MKLSKHIRDVNIMDRDTNEVCVIAIFKHPNGLVFGFDTDYLDENVKCLDSYPIVADPFENGGEVMLLR